MSRIFYPGAPAPYNDFRPNMAHAQQFQQNCTGAYLNVLPYQVPPMPPYPYFLPPPPTAPATSSFTQAFLEQYAPMGTHQPSFQSPDGAEGNIWQQQQQAHHRHPSVLLPPPSANGATVTQWPSPTGLSPATLETLLGPTDGMSTNRLDELPSFFFGQVLDNRHQHNNGGRRKRAVTPPPPQQHHLEEELHNQLKNKKDYQRNPSCDTYYSEASPPQVPPALASVGVCVQSCPAPLLLESPFMPMAGNLADLELGRINSSDHRRRLPSVSEEGNEEEEEENLARGGDGGEGGEEECDPLEGMDLEFLFQHFDGGNNNEDTHNTSLDPGSSAGTTTTAPAPSPAAAAAEEKEKHHDQVVASAQDTRGPKDYTHNMDLQTLFQSFVEDLEALPPLDLTAIGKPNNINFTDGKAFLSPPRLSPLPYYYGNGDDAFSPMAAPMQGRKRGVSSSQDEFSYDPHTPEKRTLSGNAVGSLGERRHVTVERKPPSSGAGVGGVSAHRNGSSSEGKRRGGGGVSVQPRVIAGAPQTEVVAMLPAAAKRRRLLKNGEEQEEEEEEEEYITSPSSNLPIRCVFLFDKTITQSDAGRLARIVLPRAATENYLPRCENKTGIPLTLWDEYGNSFSVVLKYWMNGRPVAKRMWLLDQCHELISVLGLEPGVQLEFYKADDGRFVVKAN